MAKLKRYVMVSEDSLKLKLEELERKSAAFKGSSFYQGFLAGQKQMAEWVLEGAALIEKKL